MSALPLVACESDDRQSLLLRNMCGETIVLHRFSRTQYSKAQELGGGQVAEAIIDAGATAVIPITLGPYTPRGLSLCCVEFSVVNLGRQRLYIVIEISGGSPEPEPVRLYVVDQDTAFTGRLTDEERMRSLGFGRSGATEPYIPVTLTR